MGKNFFYHQGLKQKYPNTKNSIREITNWDIVFLMLFGTVDETLTEIQWNEIEEIIYEVVTIFFYKEIRLSLKFKTENLKKKVEKIIRYLFRESRGNEDSILSDLKKFEKEFASYIKKEVDNNEDYYQNVTSLIERLVGENEVIVDVLNFNYSLDSEFMSKYNKENKRIEIHSWNNIHGIAN